MGPLGWIALAIGAWIVLVTLVRVLILPPLTRGPAGDPGLGLVWYALKIGNRLIHHLQVTGLEHLPTQRPAGPLLVISNHTGSLDPLLISSQCPFLIRWMMGDDMMWDRMAPLWEKLRLIAVDRTGDRPVAIREAVRTLRDGGVVGIFPEGRISLPRGEIRPFFEGVGRTDRPIQGRHSPGLGRRHTRDRPGHGLAVHTQPLEGALHRTHTL